MSKSKAARQAEVTTLLAALPAFKSRNIEFEPACPDVGSIADRLGRLAALKAEVAEYEDRLKAIVIEHGEDAVEGKLFRATLSIFEQTRLDSEKIRAEMKPQWLDKYSKTSKVTKVAIHARKGALADVAA
jgi:hypothetical protein